MPQATAAAAIAAATIQLKATTAPLRRSLSNVSYPNTSRDDGSIHAYNGGFTAFSIAVGDGGSLQLKPSDHATFASGETIDASIAVHSTLSRLRVKLVPWQLNENVLFAGLRTWMECWCTKMKLCLVLQTSSTA